MPAPVRPALSADSDAALLARAQAGDMDALGQLVLRHRPTAVRFAFAWTRDLDDAEDLVQDAVLIVHRRVHEVRSAFQPWFRQVVANRCRDWSKDVRQRGREVLREDTAFVEDAHAAVEAQELRAIVRDALAALGPTGEIIRRNIDGETFAAMEAATGLSQKMLNMRVQRARKKLAVWLASVA